jgi:hypothetical protein
LRRVFIRLGIDEAILTLKASLTGSSEADSKIQNVVTEQTEVLLEKTTTVLKTELPPVFRSAFDDLIRNLYPAPAPMSGIGLDFLTSYLLQLVYTPLAALYLSLSLLLLMYTITELREWLSPSKELARILQDKPLVRNIDPLSVAAGAAVGVAFSYLAYCYANNLHPGKLSSIEHFRQPKVTLANVRKVVDEQVTEMSKGITKVVVEEAKAEGKKECLQLAKDFLETQNTLSKIVSNGLPRIESYPFFGILAALLILLFLLVSTFLY